MNEYNYIDNFTEVAKIDSSVNLSGWTITVYTPSRTTIKTLPSVGGSSCFGAVYQISSFAANEIGTNADVVLKDGAGDVVDFLRVRTSLPVTTTYYGAPPTCGPSTVPPTIAFTGSTTDLLVSSGNKGVDRLPDGTGDWRQTPGTGSNSFQSQCGPNIVGGSADLAITKTVNTGTVVKGGAVTFTISVTNTVSGSGTATAVLVNDVLPAGLSYSNSSTATGSFSASTGVWTLGDMLAGQTATLTLTATTTLVGTVTNTANVASSTFDPVTTNNTSAASVVVTSPGAALDAVEVGATAGSPIKTKLAGQSFNLDILALDSSGNISTSYNKTVILELVDASSSGTCSAMTQLQAVGSYTFTGSGGGKDNGRHTLAFNYPNAAANVRVRMKDNSAPTAITSCSTDNFAIRPPSLAVISTDATNTATTGTPKIKAGSNFTLVATAKNLSSATISSGYSGAPTIDKTLVRDHNAVAILASALAGSFAAATGNSSSGTFQYQDVGTITLLADAVKDTLFTSVDQVGDCVANSTSNTLSGGLYGCNIGSAAAGAFGRFYPDHFTYVATLTPSCSGGGFTYMGDPHLGIALTLTAQSSTGVTTTRYTNGYPSLGTFTITGDNSGAAVDVSTRLSPTLSAFSWSSGAYAFSNAADTFVRNATPDGAYDTFALKATIVTEPDGVAILGGSLSNLTKIRFGRIKLANAYGSELLPLPMPVSLQYFNGGGWLTNTIDSCTAIAANKFAFVFPVATNNNLVACETALSVTGAAPAYNAKLTAPGVGNNGWTDMILNLGGAAIGTTCTAIGGAGVADTPANMPWLQYPAGTNPVSRATFGVYKGNNDFIYQREAY